MLEGSRMKQRNFITGLATVLFTILGLVLLTLSLFPYGTLRVVFDALMPDHDFNTLKSWNAIVFKIIFGAGGLLFLGLAALTMFRRWEWLASLWKNFWLDARRTFRQIRLHKPDLGFLAGVVVVTLMAVIFRMEKANSPMGHDEAYTFVAFSRSLFSALTDYSKPNNHVLHSILVFFSTRAFGLGAWAVRLPAFLAGVLLVPASYWLASRYYDRWTGIATAFLVAWFPPLVGYANVARGYTMVALFTLMTLALGMHVLREKNLFFWGLISLLSALGLYTVPIMLFPFGILFVWLILENQISGPDPYRTKREFLSYWLGSGLGAAVLTLLFYTPILIFTDPQKFFANDMLTPVPWRGLLETLSARFTDTWTEWTTHVPPAVVVFLVIGWILSLVFHWKIAQARVPLQLAALLWFTVLLLIKRPNVEARFWSFLMPLILMWAAAGIFGLLQKVRLRFFHAVPLAAPMIGLLLVAGFWHATRLVPQLPALWADRGKLENVVLFVEGRLEQRDMIIVSSPDDAAVWYYSDLHGIPGTFFKIEDPTYQRVLVLVDTQWHQTLDWVLSDRGPDQAQLNTGAARLLGTIDSVQVFAVPRKQGE
jgi:4-amino-4-deoxy-L-arabinose transferase-like glycosyltransferase